MDCSVALRSPPLAKMPPDKAPESLLLLPPKSHPSADPLPARHPPEISSTCTYSFSGHYVPDFFSSLLEVKSAPTLIASYACELDAAGHRTGVTELPGRTVSYGYDSIYRLTSEAITSLDCLSGWKDLQG